MTVGWGIVSTAGIAEEAVIPSLAQLDAELVGVSSRDRKTAEAFAGKHGAAFGTDSLDELLADPRIDVVYVATPNALHAEQVRAAAAAGKHVLCEKPLATSVEDGEAAVQACDDAGVKLGIMFQTRYYGAIVRLRELLASGEIGDVLIVEALISPGRAPLGSWRADQSLAGLGTTNNLGVHAYDALRFLFGEPNEVTALTDVGRRDELETIALTLVRFESGALAYVNANQAARGPRNDLVVYGTEGRIVGRGVTRPGRADAEISVLAGDDERTETASTTEGFRRLVAAFQDAVVAGRDPSPSGYDGLRSIDTTDAIRESARSGKTVEVRRRTR